MRPCSNKSEIPDAEKTHLKIVKNGYVIGLFTSSSRNTQTGEMYYYLSNEKHDGTICDYRTEDGQYVSFFTERRLLNDPTLMEIRTAKQEYMDRHESTLNILYQLYGPKGDNIRMRIGKSDPMLSHENGQKDGNM